MIINLDRSFIYFSFSQFLTVQLLRKSKYLMYSYFVLSLDDNFLHIVYTEQGRIPPSRYGYVKKGLLRILALKNIFL